MSATPPMPDRMLSPAPGTTWIPDKEDEKAAIREQLERLLASSLFRNSKRYPALLRYVVERVLDGHLDCVKERTLGIEVFRRDPNYDTNQDPVVRTTAVEVRKRLAQYYQEPGHEGEIRIEFPSGSYVPEFRRPAVAAPVSVVLPVRRRSFAVSMATARIVAGVIVVAAVIWWSPWRSPGALERFWSPVWDSADPVLICLGDVGESSGIGAGPAPTEEIPGMLAAGIAMARFESVPLAEVSAVTRIAHQKGAEGKALHVRSHMDTKFEDLRDGPVVLIGGFDNSWTVRLLDQVHPRFRLERDGPLAWISDQSNPSQRSWMVDTRMPPSKAAEDYALVSRIWNPATGQYMVTAAGLLPFGTGAAGEFLTQSRYLESAVAQAPKSWAGGNIQIVIATRLTGGSTGSPRVLAVHFW